MNFSIESIMGAILPPETLVNFLRKAIEESVKVKVTYFRCLYNAEEETIHFFINEDPEPYSFKDTKSLMEMIRKGIAAKVEKNVTVTGARVIYSPESITADIKFIKDGIKEFKHIQIK